MILITNSSRNKKPKIKFLKTVLSNAIFILVLLLSTFQSCSNPTEWHEYVLDDYHGSYRRISSGTDFVEASPESILIKKGYIIIVFPSKDSEERFVREGKVIKSNYNPSKRSSVIFFGKPDSNNIAQYRIEIGFDNRGYLSVSEIIDTGYQNEDFVEYWGIYNK